MRSESLKLLNRLQARDSAQMRQYDLREVGCVMRREKRNEAWEKQAA